MSVIDNWVKTATREQLIAKRNEYRMQASEAWHGRDNDLRGQILKAIDAQLNSPCPGCGLKMVEGCIPACPVQRCAS